MNILTDEIHFTNDEIIIEISRSKDIKDFSTNSIVTHNKVKDIRYFPITSRE